jgi:hypothetical protein
MRREDEGYLTVDYLSGMSPVGARSRSRKEFAEIEEKEFVGTKGGRKIQELEKQALA